MKKIIAILLAVLFFTGCAPKQNIETHVEPDVSQSPEETTKPDQLEQSAPEELTFNGLNDPNLLRYMEDSIYAGVVQNLNSEEYFVENVEAVYVSQEYLDELEYNSKSNIYFGYTIDELDALFQGEKYVFTLDEEGKTTVTAFEPYDDTYDKALMKVAIGTGVILVCVTVSVVTGGIGTGAAAAVSTIFSAAAKGSAIMASSGGLISGVTSGIVTGLQTEDFDQALHAAAESGSEGFMWGAVAGAVSGGVGEAVNLHGATLNGLTMGQAAKIQKESGFPLDVIKEFSSMEQYNVCKSAGLTPCLINGKTELIRNIDLNFVDEMGRTNIQRMEQGLAALDPTGKSYELHHIGQKADSTLAILTHAEHMEGRNNEIWHILDGPTEVHGPGNTWNTQRQDFWKALAKILKAGAGK